MLVAQTGRPHFMLEDKMLQFGHRPSLPQIQRTTQPPPNTLQTGLLSLSVSTHLLVLHMCNNRWHQKTQCQDYYFCEEVSIMLCMITNVQRWHQALASILVGDTASSVWLRCSVVLSLKYKGEGKHVYQEMQAPACTPKSICSQDYSS